jgi:hypothetical protein
MAKDDEPNELLARLPGLLTPEKASPMRITGEEIRDREMEAIDRHGDTGVAVYDRMRAIVEACGWSFAVQPDSGNVILTRN